MRALQITERTWPLAVPFRISRGTKTLAHTIQVTISEGGFSGRGECVPYQRYGETLASVTEQIHSVANAVVKGADNQDLLNIIEPGAARNCLDSALLDLNAKISGQAVHQQLGLPEFISTQCAQTISIGAADAMGREARSLRKYPLLKIKLDNQAVVERVTTVHNHAPNSQLILDANESWKIADLNDYAKALASCNVAFIEQPLPAADDALLADYQGSIALCADESSHGIAELEKLIGKYQLINIKLDKTGGLTAALKLLDAAKNLGFEIMIGCMVGSSLAMAPATLLAGGAAYVDLDGPALLSEDEPGGFQFGSGFMRASGTQLWGYP